jgi:hypothetical protein
MGDHRAPHQRDWFALLFWCGMGFVLVCVLFSVALVILGSLGA